jgi:hypothetical protein
MEAAMGPINEHDILGPCFYQGGNDLQVGLLCCLHGYPVDTITD